MNFLKNFLLGVLAGEVITLLQKDTHTQKKLEKAEGLQKAQVVFEELLDLNKNIFDSVATYDYEGGVKKLTKHFEKELATVEKNIDYVKKTLISAGSEQGKHLLEHIVKNYEQIKKSLEDTLSTMNKSEQK